MQTYVYKAYDKHGRVESGLIVATSVARATDNLYGRGLAPFEIKEETGRSRSKILHIGPKPTSLETHAQFARELGTLLRADLPMDQALNLMGDRSRSASALGLIQEIATRLTEGSTLSDALTRHAVGLPTFAISLVRAGETRGNIAEALEEVSSLLDRNLRLRAQIRSAITYPLILTATAVAVLGIVVVYLLPALMPLFRDQGVEPPMALAVVDGLGNVISGNWQLLLFLMLVTVLCIRILARTPRGSSLADSIALNIPIIGPIRRDANLAVFARTLGSLLRSGVAVVEALHVTSHTARSISLARSLEAAAESVRQGQQLSKSLQNAGHVTDLAIRFISVGESVGKLDHMLLQLAKTLDEDTERRIDRAMTLLTPALTLIIGFAVGGLILSVMQAVIGINELATAG